MSFHLPLLQGLRDKADNTWNEVEVSGYNRGWTNLDVSLTLVFARQDTKNQSQEQLEKATKVCEMGCLSCGVL